ncbi:MAG TPA: hypothetical protein VK700_11230 [Steroidobacteraceae bacterium]|jgi:hypothetical protein|nr:hypothetical protein [Steroidobacteraceae bacterium]
MNLGDAKSMDRLERALQASLRPIDPGADFTAALVARLAAAPAAMGGPVTVVSARRRRLHSASLGLAASVLVALAVSWQLLDVRAVQRAEQTRIHAQLLLALEITSERLGLAQQRIEQYQSQEKNL